MEQTKSRTGNHIIDQGGIRYEIGNLSMLQSLFLDGNRLIGTIPYSIGGLSNLEIFSIGNNSFHSHIPRELGQLSSLIELSLYLNKLEGEIPESIFNLSKLTMVELSHNKISGNLPSSIGNVLPKLFRLYLNGNQLSGEIPMSISNLSRFHILDLKSNSFTGRVPTLGNLQILDTLDIADSRLTNDHSMLELDFIISLTNCKSLSQLDAGSSGIKGPIPNEIGNFSNLIQLFMGGNDLNGEIPNQLGKLKKLQKLDLSSSKLKGSIPATLCDLGQIGSVKGMQVLNLSGNQFSSDIPKSIGRLENLENLIFSGNELHGYISESFSELVALQYLDLSQNGLIGAIPKSLETLKNLVYLNVSFNELSGEIPSEGIFKNLTASSFTGNRDLCGASQFEVMQCKANTTISSSKTRVLKYILPSIVLVIILAIIVVWLMTRCNRNTTLTSQSSSLITIKRISYYDILKSTNNFDDENLIGRGSIGSVYKGAFFDGMIAAIKVFNLDLEAANKSFDTECNIRHRNLVKLISSCSNLDLKALRLEIMMNLASALVYLHHGHPSPVVHYDLKPSSVLLDEDMVVHVADFGISKLLTEDQRILHTQTLEYGSTGILSTMADVYSYGIILMETFTKKKPTYDIFVGDLNMRGWLFDLYPDKVTQAVDVDLVDGVEKNIEAKVSCFRSTMGLALECTSDLPEEQLNMENVLIRFKKIKMEFLSNITEEE
ncbi:probable LRR receptor-like serine threonine-kinase At3g47570 [Olea europaea subsp. europaea]|uniref:Probable LRR receptor-like serine threonine-kinase At3g47570 n=1 Tax=Olea europaea subsp. europaea TaxID=158383 RepID=A0A8S0RUQ9_OLEEU|nr:probable LRR receptor-like serine threonine-kinase At3g47570 [Olea europaea subsp. europaea]